MRRIIILQSEKKFSKTDEQPNHPQDHASENVNYWHVIVEKKTPITIHQNTCYHHLPFHDFAEDLLQSIKEPTSLSQIHNPWEILNNMQSIALTVQEVHHGAFLIQFHLHSFL